MTEGRDDSLLENVRAALDQSVDQLDVKIRLSLDQSRRQALLRNSVAAVNEPDDGYLDALLNHLDDGSLEPEIHNRLNLARSKALDRARQPDRAASLLRLLLRSATRKLLPVQLTVPVSAFATACLVLTAVTLFYRFPDAVRSGAEETDILLTASNEEIELYENLDFYLWLADNGLPD